MATGSTVQYQYADWRRQFILRVATFGAAGVGCISALHAMLNWDCNVLYRSEMDCTGLYRIEPDITGLY